MDLPVLPRFTGTQEEQTTAKKAHTCSHSDESSKCIASLSLRNWMDKFVSIVFTVNKTDCVVFLDPIVS